MKMSFEHILPVCEHQTAEGPGQQRLCSCGTNTTVSLTENPCRSKEVEGETGNAVQASGSR